MCVGQKGKKEISLYTFRTQGLLNSSQKDILLGLYISKTLALPINPSRLTGWQSDCRTRHKGILKEAKVHCCSTARSLPSSRGFQGSWLFQQPELATHLQIPGQLAFFKQMTFHQLGGFHDGTWGLSGRWAILSLSSVLGADGVAPQKQSLNSETTLTSGSETLVSCLLHFPVILSSRVSMWYDSQRWFWGSVLRHQAMNDIGKQWLRMLRSSSSVQTLLSHSWCI